MREQALSIIEAGINRVLPQVVMRSSLVYDREQRILTVSSQPFDLSQGRVFVVGGGKAAGSMAESLEEILGTESITAGMVVTKYGAEDYRTDRIRVAWADHPVPDEAGVKAVQQMLNLKTEHRIGMNDIVLCLLSGGGSALIPSTADEISLEHKQLTTGLLLECGADITEINTVRKHLSRTKGGRLGQFYAPATVISLILSDVVGNDLAVIASGPTYPDASTFTDALHVLEKYQLLSKAPAKVVGFLERGAKGLVEETPKRLDNCHNFIIGDITLALNTMMLKAKEMGLRPYLVSAAQTGDTGTVAQRRAAEILDKKYNGYDALIMGGETTPKLKPGSGKGGRNQHYAAVSLLAMKDYPGEWLVASVGTDGSDYLADIAGAMVDSSSLSALNQRKVDMGSYIERFDSYHLLEQAGNSLIRTGNTGTNVGDVIIYLLG